MKLVSINAIIIASCTLSIFIKVYIECQELPPLTLMVLSLIFTALLLLLEYQHRQFKHQDVNIDQTTSLFRKYLYLFAAGLAVTVVQKGVSQPNQYFMKYIFLDKNLYYTALYYFTNYILGQSYLYLFKKAYILANRDKIPFEIAAFSDYQQKCAICLNSIVNGQKIAKIACIHTFHSICLNKWIKCKASCPICISPINQV